MPYLHLLGTGSAMSDPHRTVTMLALEDREDVYLIDCGGDAVQRMLLLGIPLEKLRGLIITHAHPDHVAGFPLLMEKLWLAGRRAALPIYGIEPALQAAERLLGTFDTSGWEGMPDRIPHVLELRDHTPVLESGPWRISASPGTHSVPVLGLRVEYDDAHAPGSEDDAGEEAERHVVVYSGDTEYAESIRDLATAADILVHEATGSHANHSSALDAARVGREAQCRRVLLVHLPPQSSLGDDVIAEARESFPNLDRGSEGGSYLF